MFKNYLKSSFRYLWKQRVFSSINLIGLAVGFCAVFFTLMYVHFELSYDQYHEQSDNIYRVVTDVHSATGIDYQSTSAPLAKAAEADFPEVKKATRLFLDYFIVQKDMKSDDFNEEKIAYADASLFEVFSFPMQQGNPATALNAPFQAVLTQHLAQKYFGKENVVGQTIYLDGKLPVTITGIMKDIPQNSHINVDMLLSMSTLLKEFQPNMDTRWERFGMYTYLLVQPNADLRKLNAGLSALMNNHATDKLVRYDVSLEPLKDVYLKRKPRGSRTGTAESGNLQNLYIFLMVAVLILFIAGFNFVNLSTALSLQRSKEIGVRKVIGATRKNLVIQFLMDAMLISILAFAVSMLLCVALLPLFNELCGKPVITNIFAQWKYLSIFLAVAIATAFLSGLYPAFVLSAFKPAIVLKGKNSKATGGLLLRKAFVVTQFAISITLIIGTLVAYSQLHFMQTKSPGFKKEQQIAIDFHFAAPYETVRRELLSIPGIESISVSSAVPGRPNRKMPISIESSSGTMAESSIDMYFVDFNFLEQYKLEVLAGRGFSPDFSTDSSTAVVINETMLKSLGYHNAEAILGKRFAQGAANATTGTVIGVIKDFHFHSFHEQIRPLAMRVHPGSYTFLTLSLQTQHLQNTITQVASKWKTIAPGLPLIHFFVDESFNQQYIADNRTSKLIFYFSALAIFISCMGLYALSYLSVTQRTKEISIRKVLGAGAFNIASLLSKDFIQLVAIAIVLAIPFGWWMMQQWLYNFAYRIDIEMWMIGCAAVLALIIAVITVNIQTIRVALENPVRRLRNE